MIRIMRLWHSGMATPIGHCLSPLNAFRYAYLLDGKGRLWIEDEKRPAVDLGTDWKPQSLHNTR